MAKRFKRDIFSGEVIEVDEPASPTGRTIIFKGSLPFGDATVMGRSGQTSAIRADKKHVSMSLGVHRAQAKRFNADLRECGITNASYSEKTGFLESTDREDRAAAFALRGHYDYEGGAVEQRYANAIGF